MKQPVLVILNGLAAVVSLGMVAAAQLHWVTLDAGAQAAVVAFVAAVANLAALAIRATVVPVPTHQAVVAQVAADTRAQTLADVDKLAA